MATPPDDDDDFPAFESESDLDKTVELSRSAVAKLGALRAQGPRPYLLAIGGPASGQMFNLPDKIVTLGRSHQATITLVDDGISRKHAQIAPKALSWELKDLNSTNGVYLNGERTKEALLEDGDQIRIGSNTILKFSLQDGLEEDFQRKMYDQAVRDSLTDIFNKRYFIDSLTTEFAYYSRHNLALSVVMLDIDFFKKVNDTYGHVAGDYVLKVVAKLIGKSLRTEDILCRYGGEEFAIILRSTDANEALLVCERIRKAIAAYGFDHDGRDIAITVSMGIATLRDTNFQTAQDLVKEADKYLYKAKEAGRNRSACAPYTRKGGEDRKTTKPAP